MRPLIQKELREHQLFFFLSLAFVLLSVTILIIFKHKINKNNIEWIQMLFYIAVPFIFAVLFGTLPFTKEFTQNTKPFLLTHPVSSTKIFWIKIFTALASLLILLVFLYLAGAIFFKYFYGLKDNVSLPRTIDLFYFFLSAILIYSASLLGSLLFKNFFPSILGVPFFLLLIGLVFSPFFVFLFLLAPSLHIFFILLFSSTIGLFLTLSFVIWQKESVSDTGAVKKSLKILVSIFVISLFIHGICNLISEVELRKSIEQAKSLGLKLRIEEIIPPAVPDEKNGAVVYEEAFKLVDSLQKRYKEEWEYVFPTSKYIPISNVGQLLEESTLEEKNRLSRIVEDPEFILLYKLVEKAVKMPECRFDVEYQAGVDMSHTQIVKMGEAAKIVAVKTGLLVSEGRFQESLDSAILLWKMGDSFANEPLLISQASRTQIKKASIYTLRKIFETTTLVKFPQEQMDELIKISKDKEMELFLNGFIKGDTTVYLSLFSSTKDRLDGYYFEDVLPFPFYGSYLLRPIFKKDQSCYLKFFVKRMELFSEPYFVSINKSKKLDEQFADYKSFKTKKLLFSSMLLTSNRFFLKRQAEHIVNLDTLKLILALKIYHDKHHNYPNSLALLAPNIIPEVPIDPFTGKDYIYRLEGKGFVLDSAGAKKE